MCRIRHKNRYETLGKRDIYIRVKSERLEFLPL